MSRPVKDATRRAFREPVLPVAEAPVKPDAAGCPLAQEGRIVTSSLGLIELLLVLLGAMGWGAYELWSVRRNRSADDKKRR
jgi:hypothetical protein